MVYKPQALGATPALCCCMLEAIERFALGSALTSQSRIKTKNFFQSSHVILVSVLEQRQCCYVEFSKMCHTREMAVCFHKRCDERLKLFSFPSCIGPQISRQIDIVAFKKWT